MGRLAGTNYPPGWRGNVLYIIWNTDPLTGVWERSIRPKFLDQWKREFWQTRSHGVRLMGLMNTDKFEKLLGIKIPAGYYGFKFQGTLEEYLAKNP